MKVSDTKHIVNLLVNRNQLIEDAMNDFSLIRQGRPREEARAQATTQVEEVWSRLFDSLKSMILAVLIGLLCGGILSRVIGPSQKLASSLQYFGTFVMVWATLAKAGWKVETFDGSTLMERVNDKIFRSLYMLGTFSVTVGLLLSF